jgi:hypothetical protein
VAAASLAAVPAAAPVQDLEPALYQNAPVGLNAAAVSYVFSTGNVLADASVPLADATADVHTIGLAYVRTLDVFGHAAKVDALVPIAFGTFKGTVNGEFLTRSPSGLADPRVRFMVNLLGAPALEPKEFASYRQKTILGVSLQMVAPLGQYDPSRFVNLGSNRWAFRPELGVSHAWGRWYLEAAAGAWLFTKNHDVFGGATLAQDPLLFVKAQIIYTFRRGLWLSANYGRADGGETSLNGGAKTALQRNNRLGATLSVPLGRPGALKLVYTTGLTTLTGADFDSYGVVYQITW